MADLAANLKLHAILAADVAGYSRLMQDDDRATVRTLEEYRAVFRGMTQSHRGRVVDMAGDSVLAVFESATAAVRAAIEIQSLLAKRNEAHPEPRRMRFRIGINLGEVIENADGTVYGDGVNVAARLESIADPGGITVSGTVFDQVKNRIHVGFRFTGDQQVKNIAEAVRAYRVEVTGTPFRPPSVVNWIRPRAIVVGSALVVLLLALAALYLHYRAEPARAPSTLTALPTTPDKHSIAVLPFANMSGDPTQEYFADGMTEEIITSLSRLPGLYVIARNSTFQYKGKSADVREIGTELGVRYILEGSVRKSDQTLRVTAQLIDAADGKHVWAQRYDGKLADVFAVQDAITRQVVEELDVRLVSGEQARVWRRTTSDVEAYELYLKGSDLNARNPTKENLLLARKYLQEAIKRDPKFAAAYTHLTYTHMLNVLFGFTDSPKKEIAQGFQAARRAIELDDFQGQAYTALGRLHMQNDELDKALMYGKRGMELEPNSPIAQGVYAHMLEAAGRPTECLTHLHLAMRLGPYREPWWPWMEGLCLLQLRRADEAVRAIQKSIELYGPEMLFPRVFLVHAYVAAGKEQEARAEVQKILLRDPSFSVDAFLSGFHFYRDPGIVAGYAANLRKAGLK
jgi:adenylate cyclase